MKAIIRAELVSFFTFFTCCACFVPATVIILSTNEKRQDFDWENFIPINSKLYAHESRAKDLERELKAWAINDRFSFNKIRIF